MSVQPFGGGAIWAGRQGIHYYDGIQVTNLIAAKLGDVWKNSINSFDPSKYRMWSMVNRNHYMLFIENLAPTLAIVKGNVSTTPTSWCVVINMTTRAVSFMTNINFRGAITLPASTGKNVWYLVNGRVTGESSDHAFIADGEALFAEEGRDPIISDPATVTGNFITNPSFETNAFFWSAFGTSTILSNATQAKFGTRSGLLTINDANNFVQSSSVTLTAATYTASTWLWIDPASSITSVQLSHAGSFDGVEGVQGGDPFVKGQWIRLWRTLTPAAVLTGVYRFTFIGAAPGDKVWIDGVQIEAGSVATTYCDGTQPWCYWTGAAHASTSGRVTTIAGPDWFFESKKFDAGAALRLKRIKQLAIHFLSQGDGIAVDTVLGLNNIGTTLTAYFPASVFTWDTLRTSVPTWVALKNQFSTWNSIVSAVFIPKRVRFLKRSQHFSFRLYARSTSVTRARIGPYEIGYKLMRPGRV
jgi:hypothetical protein